MDDPRDANATAASNGLLLPDRESLGRRTKPFEWTWTSRTTADDVAAEISDGMDRVIDELGRMWNVPIPPSGIVPRDERPNMLVRLIRPALLDAGHALFLPFFTTRELGLACKDFAGKPGVELVDAPASTVPLRQKAIGIALHGIDRSRYRPGITHLNVVQDPVPNESWTNVITPFHHRLSLHELTAETSTGEVFIPVIDRFDRVWLWQELQRRDEWR